jgi:hypothetical protein
LRRNRVRCEQGSSMDVMILSLVAGLVAIAIAAVWFARRARRDRMAELRKDDRIDLFHNSRD